MIVGVLKEIKDNENRVALTPKGTSALVGAGHTVLVENSAGLGSGLEDAEYEKKGAQIVSTPEEICKTAELILKIKEPLPQEYALFNDKNALFTYFHFASRRQLTEAMLASNTTCIAYETVEGPNNSLPLLAPMSEVAGKMSALIGAYYLAKFNGGRGVLVSSVSGTKPAEVVVLGGGKVGAAAATIAAGIGADLTILEINDNRIAELKKQFPNAKILKSNKENIASSVKAADILVGAVLVEGAAAPKLVTEEMVKSMRKGTVIVDVAIDQGGCIETSKPTSHSDPVYTKHGVVHYCVTNMPGAYPRTSTFALTAATLPYVLELANKGIIPALKANQGLFKGLNIYKGKVTHKGVAEAFDLPYTNPKTLF